MEYLIVKCLGSRNNESRCLKLIFHGLLLGIKHLKTVFSGPTSPLNDFMRLARPELFLYLEEC